MSSDSEIDGPPNIWGVLVTVCQRKKAREFLETFVQALIPNVWWAFQEKEPGVLCRQM